MRVCVYTFYLIKESMYIYFLPSDTRVLKEVSSDWVCSDTCHLLEYVYILKYAYLI